MRDTKTANKDFHGMFTDIDSQVLSTILAGLTSDLLNQVKPKSYFGKRERCWKSDR